MTTRERLPNRRPCVTQTITVGEGSKALTLAVCAGFDPASGHVREVFVDCGKEGSTIAEITADTAVTVSVALQHGVPLDALAHSILRLPVAPTRPEDLDGRPVETAPASPIGAILDVLISLQQDTALGYAAEVLARAKAEMAAAIAPADVIAPPPEVTTEPVEVESPPPPEPAAAEPDQAIAAPVEQAEAASPEEVEPPRANNGSLVWTPARLSELERHVAAGLSYVEIAAALGCTLGAVKGQASVRGFTKTYPRDRNGAPLFDVYPLDRPWPRPVPQPIPRTDRERMIAEHIARHGVVRSVDFGPDQPAVDALRKSGATVLKGRNPRQPWLVNGAPRTTNGLWQAANNELGARGEPRIRREAKAS